MPGSRVMIVRNYSYFCEMLRGDTDKNLKWFLILAMALFLPAYLLNLGQVQLIRDEAIRATVAFEMLKSGDFITPTISGEPYFNKPPLYNWVLALFFFVTGSYSEVVLRLPVILAIILFSLTIYYFVRREYGPKIALVNALAFITYGRIIFYESLHGLIDITFSWLTYSFFMLSWHYFRREKYLRLFLAAYAITAVSYLLKGFPSLFFTAASLLVLFISGRRFRILLGWKHIAGILLLLIIVGGYYLAYFLRNPVEPGKVLEVLTGEVTRRTVVHFGIWQTLLNLFTYPFENIYHFLPWSLLVLVFLKKGAMGAIRRDPFLKYSALIFIVNILPYWTSPEGYPRYILMLIPLAMTIMTVLYYRYRESGDRLVKWTDGVIGAMIAGGGMIGILFLFHPATRDLPGIAWVAALLMVSVGGVSYFYWNQPANRLLWLAVWVLVFRIAFNFSLIPSWERTHPVVPTRVMAKELAKETTGRPLKFYWNPEFSPDPYFGYRYNNEIFNYYLSTGRDEMTPIGMEETPGVLFIAKMDHLQGKNYRLIRQLKPAWQDPVWLIEFNSPEPRNK